MNKKPLYIAIGAIVALALLITVIQAVLGHSTTSEVSRAISQQSSNLSTLKSTGFKITSVKEPVADWYVAKLVPSGNFSDSPTVILHRKSDGTFAVVAGPGTSFRLSDLRNNGVPQAVQNTVLVYNDLNNN